MAKDESSPALLERPRLERERELGAARRRAGGLRAGARLRALAIPRNFDAGTPEPACDPYHRFTPSR
jgi:hypothetical protein